MVLGDEQDADRWVIASGRLVLELARQPLEGG
jgi:hypothetical protein